MNELRTFAKGRNVDAHKNMTKIQLEDLTNLKNLYSHQELKSLYPHKGLCLPRTENNKIEDNIMKDLINL